MRINAINQNLYRNNLAQSKKVLNENPKSNFAQRSNNSNINFNGYCGKIAGILAGGAAAVGLAIVAAPVLICAGPALAAVGMVAGDKAEDSINEAMDDKK